MKNIFLCLVLWVITAEVYGQWYWGNVDGKDTAVNLTKRVGNDQDPKSIEFGTTDPSVSTTSASKGSIFIGTDRLFQKQDNGSSTSWLPYMLGPILGGTDNCIARWDGSGTSLLQDSVVCISDLGAITGALSLSVGDLSIANSTINSTSGALTLPSTVNLSNLGASLPLLLDASNNIISSQINMTTQVSATLPIANGGTNSGVALNNNRIMQSSGGAIVEATAISASQALVSDLNGIPVASPTSADELSYVDGVTSPIQAQLDGKEPTLTKGDLTSSTPSLSILGGTQAVIGAGTVLSVSTADTNTTGLLTDTDWDTFNNKEPALTKGNLTSSTPSLVVFGGLGSVIGTGTALSVSTATASQDGLLSSADWSTFNNKSGPLTGTANQVSVSSSTGAATLSLPQNIHTGASPTFAGVTVTSASTSTLNVSSLTASRPVKTDSGKNLVSGQIDLSSSNEVSNVLGFSNGGTNASTSTAAITGLLPSQAGNANEFLKTDGTSVSWQQPTISDTSAVTIPSTTSAEIIYFSFGDTATTPCTTGTCAYLDQIGSRVSSVDRNGASEYTAYFTKTFAKIKCLPGAVSNGGSVIITGDFTDSNSWSSASSASVNMSFCGGSLSCIQDTYNVGGHIGCVGY